MFFQNLLKNYNVQYLCFNVRQSPKKKNLKW